MVFLQQLIYYIKTAAILQRGPQKKTWLHQSPAAGWGDSNVEGDGGDKAPAEGHMDVKDAYTRVD